MRRSSYFPIILSAVSIILSIFLFAIIRYQYVPRGYDIGVDVFYHIRMGDFFPRVCTGKIFPWTELSIWKNHFFDKELGFHALLSFLIYITKHIGNSKLLPPFNNISIIMYSTFAILITFLLLYQRIKLAFLAVPLITFISPLFFLRISMVRPHMLAIMLFFMASFLLASEISFKKKMVLFFIISWVFTLCYSVPHILLILPIAYFLGSYISGRESFKRSLLASFELTAMIILGLFCALTLHPQFPNSYYCWYIQGVLVIKNILRIEPDKVVLGQELLAPSIDTLKSNIVVFVIFILSGIIIFFMSQREKKSLFLILFFFSIGFITVLGFFISERAIEYAVPSTVIVFLIAIDRLFTGKKFLIVAMLSIAIAFASFIYNRKEIERYVKDATMSPCYDFAAWAIKHIKFGKYIGNLRWGDFPRLFFIAPMYRYSMAMDPMFSYYLYPKAVARVEKFKYLIEPIEPHKLAKLLRTNLVFISYFDPIPAKYLIANGAKILYHGSDGWLLDLIINKRQK